MLALYASFLARTARILVSLDFATDARIAIVEGINTKLKLLKRCGFGFRNLINFEIRALLFWHFPKK
ncbi:transposase [Microcoleus sp. N3A4]|uniref:transposase n=1 Tax=Microcoleus sp. N3A4 TaxID=3055379 RepID=UPI002FD5A7AC